MQRRLRSTAPRWSREIRGRAMVSKREEDGSWEGMVDRCVVNFEFRHAAIRRSRGHAPSVLSSPAHRRRFFLPPFSLPLFSPLVSHMSALGAVNISPAVRPPRSRPSFSPRGGAACGFGSPDGSPTSLHYTHTQIWQANRPKDEECAYFFVTPPSPCPPTAPGFDFRPHPSSIRLGIQAKPLSVAREEMREERGRL